MFLGQNIFEDATLASPIRFNGVFLIETAFDGSTPSLFIRPISPFLCFISIHFINVTQKQRFRDKEFAIALSLEANACVYADQRFFTPKYERIIDNLTMRHLDFIFAVLNKN
jgi:hypothetical protein